MALDFANTDWSNFSKELISIRRDLHAHPESGWTEFRTTSKIISALKPLGVEIIFGKDIHTPQHMYGMPSEAYIESCMARAIEEGADPTLLEAMKGGFTGCVAIIETGKEGPTTAFRVDIDCNDVGESLSSDHRPAAEGFASKHPNLMHACGHDAHAAIGIGTVKLLCQYKEQLTGKILVIFQPAEEGLRGANSITQTGLLDKVDNIFGGHVGLGMGEVGVIASSTTGFLASTKTDVTFKGKAAHAGASPEEGHNALAAAASATLNMLAIPRHSEGSSRINIGTFNAGTGRNVIPEEATLTLETRGGTTKINEYMHENAMRICKASADMYQCEFESKFMGAGGSADCTPSLVEFTEEVLATIPEVKTIAQNFSINGGEDYTYMMNRVQEMGGRATEMVLACNINAPHHNGFFDIDEAIIPLGAKIFASLAIALCK